MNTGKLLFAVSVVGLMIAGCSAEALDPQSEPNNSDTNSDTGNSGEPSTLAAPVAAEGEGRDVSGLDLGPLWTEYWLPGRGGGGGSYTGHAASGVIYAVQINAGKYVDHISFAYYSPSNWDNRYRAGDFWGTVGPFGGSGGTSNPWIYCPAGQGVIGLRGAAGALVDRIGVICGDVTNPDPNSPSNWYSPIYGGGGGGWFSDSCVPGYLFNAFNVRSGALLDQIQGICIRAH